MADAAIPSSRLDTLHPYRSLNAADRLMLVSHEGLRRLGHAGFSCQSHVWLDGQIDLKKLDTALAQLAHVHPVVTSRIVNLSDDHTEWHYRDSGAPAVQILELLDDDESSVLRLAEELLAEEWDLDRVDPIVFRLLRRPSGCDVLIVQWNHALMDGKAPELVLAELNRLSDTAPVNPTSLPANGGRFDDACRDDADGVADVLNRHSNWRRFVASWRIIASHLRPPARSITLEPDRTPAWVFKPIRIAVRTLNTADTAALADRVRRNCGLLNLTPAILASVYRVMARLTPREISSRSLFRTDVPLNLRPPGATGPIFRNFMSFISLHAGKDELQSRDELTRLLHRRMRDQLARGADIGNLAMMDWMSRRPDLLHRHLLSRMQKYPLTLGFGFLGPLTAGLDNLLGVPIERFYTLNMAMSPPGCTLQANLCRDQLNLALTYIEAVIPESLAMAFLDGLVNDLIG